LRSEADKWRVPESDPAGKAEHSSVSVPRSGVDLGSDGDSERGNLIFCGMCGALNPSTNYYCAACGSTLVDAFHATEGLRVFEKADAASRIIEIVSAGSELDIVDDPEAPSDYIRIRLPSGKLGYVRLGELANFSSRSNAGSSSDESDINTNARGCVSTPAALASLALLVLLAGFAVYLLNQDNSSDAGFLALITCVVIGPIALLMIFLYLMARDREDRRLEEAELDQSEAVD
jgi:hypothetical protein